MTETDIDAIMATFAVWNKTRGQYAGYFKEQQRDQRVVLVAVAPDDREAHAVIGYGCVVWRSKYAGFHERNVPEIVDLNVITAHQRQGVGSALIAAAEWLVAGRGFTQIGISVEQSPEYAAAQRLYPQLGYTPVGCTAHNNQLHLIKALAPPHTARS
ncbi:MAG: GNAT family N-acetyltransferase [Chloroflexi bacterium]|nr:GNAT family N-acetyltransferase [Chloroflexota bacterium]